MKQEIYRYDLFNTNEDWLGTVILTKDGLFSAVTDWGNFANSLLSDNDNLRESILEMDENDFSELVETDMELMDKSDCFSRNILPALKEAIKKELEDEA